MFDWLRPEDVPLIILIFAVLTLVIHFIFKVFWPPKP